MELVSIFKNKKTGQDGFSLIEVLIAISILSIGMLALAALQVSAIRGNALGKKKSLAVALAEAKIEEFRNTPYASIAGGITTEEDLSLGEIYTRQSTIEDNVPTTGMKTITVQVSWEDTKIHRVQLRTIMAQNG
jgi:type IV pilus assembly protein PilV